MVLHYLEPFRISPKATTGANLIIRRTAKWFVQKISPEYGAGTRSHNIVLKVFTDEGIVGLGASSPSRLVTGETAKSVLDSLDRIGPRLIGTQAPEMESTISMIDSLVSGNPSAKAMIDIAFHDIWGKSLQEPLSTLLGERKEVLTDKCLGIKRPKEMAEDAVKAVEEGFKVLKLKVGTDPQDDLKRVDLVRQTVGNNIQLRIDANQGWTSKQAIEILKRMEKFDIQFVEQPVPARGLQELADVKKNSPIPIMADESVHSPQDAVNVIEAKAADMINIKLMKCGGILKAREIASIAEAAEMPCMIGCMGESEIGIAAGAHLAAATANIRYADLDSDLFFREKLVKKGGTPLKNSMRAISAQPGLGIEELDEELLGKPIRTYS